MSKSIEQIEGLIRTIEDLPDPEARANSVALVQALIDFHGEALDRLMEIVASQGENGYSIFDRFSEEEQVSSLLLLYGLHPLPLQTRVVQALDKVRPHLDSHGGSVELLEINDCVVRLRLQGTCRSCPSSTETLKLAIEAAIYSAAPDVVSIETEGAIGSTTSTGGFVQIAKSAGNGKYDIVNCQMPTEKMFDL